MVHGKDCATSILFGERELKINVGIIYFTGNVFNGQGKKEEKLKAQGCL